MGAYILRRLLLIIPTMFGIMAISFAVVQFAPGGPVERVIAQLTGSDVSATARISGGGGDFAGVNASQQPGGDVVSSKYRGAQGLDPDFIKSLERQYGFDKPLVRALRPDAVELCPLRLRPELLPRHRRPRADRRENAGVDLARPVDDAPLLRHLDSARHPQGDQGRFALRHLDERRHRRRLRHPRLSGRGAAHHPLRRRQLPRPLPAARPLVGPICECAVLADG